MWKAISRLRPENLRAAFTMGIPWGARMKKQSHFEVNGIEVENVPRGGGGRGRGGCGRKSEGGFHHGNPCGASMTERNQFWVKGNGMNRLPGFGERLERTFATGGIADFTDSSSEGGLEAHGSTSTRSRGAAEIGTEFGDTKSMRVGEN
jgi:hypothetical protein